ncbi:MAG: glycosyltransferase family 4 protein [Chitinophagales bacterium]|nr:glycosyltransferase family 4 protein [Chitinophagales bacterium]MCZ2392721.1 glycosyltransferase family 4 protein [Chitinophagales bacterium]
MSELLKILILNYEYPPLGGGAGIVTKHLADRFANKGYLVYIVTTWFPGEPEFSSDGNLTIVRLKSKRKVAYKSNPLEMMSWALAARKYFKEFPAELSFDICLANFTLPGGIVAQYVKKRWNIPYVILSHGHDIPWFAPKQMLAWHILAYPWIKKIMIESSKNIILTEDLKINADKFLGSKTPKNIVIPNGMLMEHYKSGFDSQKKNVSILFVGRMVEQKDPLSFVESCKLINQLNIPAHFIMIGEGPLKSQVEKRALQLELRNIEVLGQVSHYDVLKNYENVDLLILPSREEAMSMAVLEALSRGVYVLCTEVSGTKGLIIEGVNGDFIRYNNPSSIAENVADFYYNKFLKDYQYPDDLARFLFDRYSWNKVANEYLNLFSTICNKEKPIDILSIED